VIRTPLLKSKGQSHQAALLTYVRQLQRWALERVGCGKLLCSRLLGGAKCFGAHGGGERRGHIVAAARLQLVIIWCSYGECNVHSYKCTSP